MEPPPLPPIPPAYEYPAPAPPAGAPPITGCYPVAYATLPPAPPRVWTVFLAFVTAFFVGSVAAGIVALIVAVAIHGPELLQDQSRIQSALLAPAVFLPMLFATQVVIIGVALGAALLSPVPLRRRLRLLPARLPWYGYGVVAAGTIALGYASGILIELLGFGDHGVLQEFEQAMAGLRGPLLVVAAVVIGLSPGFGEEFLFRGYIQTRLRQRWPRLLAIATTAGLFGLIHFDLVQGAFAVALGLFLGEVADRTGSIWPCVVGHTINNAGATVMSALVGSGETPTPEQAWLGLALSVPLFAACLLYVLRRPVAPPDRVAQPPESDPSGGLLYRVP